MLVYQRVYLHTLDRMCVIVCVHMRMVFNLRLSIYLFIESLKCSNSAHLQISLLNLVQRGVFKETPLRRGPGALHLSQGRVNEILPSTSTGLVSMILVER